MTMITLNSRELATVLAALRYWQAGDSFTQEQMQSIRDIATDGGTFDPLSDREIDKLCEAINHE